MKQHWSLLVAGMILALLLGPAARAAEPAAKPELKIGYLPITDHLTIIAAAQHEFTQSTVTPVRFSSWAELAEALKSGAVDGAYALTPISLNLRQKGVPIRAVLLGHRNGSALTVRAIPEIKTVADLKGRTIAIPSRFSTHNILVHKLLKDNGLDADKDIKTIELAPPEMLNALSTGRIDGYIVAEPFGAQAELRQIGKILVLSKDIWPDHICCVLNIRENVINEHPAAVQELVSALVQTSQFITAHPDDAAQLSKKYLGQKPEVLLHALIQPKGRVTYDNLTPDPKDFSATQDYLLQLGILKQAVDLNQYLEPKFATEAYKQK